MKKSHKIAAISAIALMVAIVIAKSIWNSKGSFTVAVSMIASGASGVWEWLPGNIGTISMVSGVILTWVLLYKGIQEGRIATRKLREMEKEKSP